ncbi:MAG TPA: SGNH/GDSL hydrolase family protein [Xanthobacteraceae bacterium]|nr:SGNH/GDSL hydrolase family protein [Xanthobacteraceae bacterium]
MRTFSVPLLLVLLAASPYAAADDCDVPDNLVETFARLPHVDLSAKHDHKLEILVLSAAPKLSGEASTLKSYPYYLESELRERLKGVDVHVFAQSEPRKTIVEVAKDLPRFLSERQPVLVIWQTGTVEAMRGIDPDGYGRALDAGVAALQRGGADVILVNQQFSPRTDFMFDGAPYTENMRWVSQTRDIPLFNRYEVMKYWGETGAFDLTALKNDGTYEKVHRCIGRLIADLVIRAASLSGTVER